ncbi:hypothetical protein [Clostridium botulinum]|uniref:hypothetical protein n=1 Tax=Clostridium botulinum TaxID=1491 RepID=UPI000773C0DB|nr:hypothetical protein [Clostridium botulinum]MBY6931051.1 hypothetical protein [Clostridium botulinum]NFG19956.1 hypothetical protein [Clostridium botulinum]NFO82258.1 hypothetical protein [Clostridium botulinum]
MGRAEDRKMRRKIDKKVGKGTVDRMAQNLNQEVVNWQVNERCKKFESYLIDSVIEAMKRNGLNNSLVKRISDDIEIILRKKVHGVE